MPLFREDALVEADVPYATWLRAAAGSDQLSWLLKSFSALPSSLRRSDFITPNSYTQNGHRRTQQVELVYVRRDVNSS